MTGMHCHKSSRKVICGFMANNTELHKQEVFELMKFNAINELIHRKVDKSLQTWEHYLDEMANDTRCFADATFVKAAALYLKKDILIAGPTNTPQQPWTLVSGSIPGTSFKSQGLPLTLFRMDLHYEPIVRIKTETNGCRGCGDSTKDISEHLAQNEKKLCHLFYAKQPHEKGASVTEGENTNAVSDECLELTGQHRASLANEHEPCESPTTAELPKTLTEKGAPSPSGAFEENYEPVIIHKWECNQCHAQLSSAGNLWKHKKDLDCMSKWCKSDGHEHEFVVEKFNTKKEAEEFANILPGQWIKKSGLADKNLRKACLKSKRGGKCGAKYSIIPEKRKNDTTEYVVRACLGHTHEGENTPLNDEEVQEEVEVKLFPSLRHALDHIHDNELDSQFRIMKDVPRDYGSYRRYGCRRRETYVPKTHQSKKNTGCNAYFSLSIKDDHVQMRTLPKHNHIASEKAVMSKKCKEELAEPLSQGVSPFEVMKRLINKDIEERTKGRLPNHNDLYRLGKKVNPGAVDTTKKEHVNVFTELELEAWRGFSIKKYYKEVPEELKDKEVSLEDDKILFCYMTEEQRSLFRKFPKHIMLDTSHKTNRHGLLYGSVMVLDARGAGLPVMHYLIESEGHASIKPVMKILKNLEPDACQRIITCGSDLNQVFIKNARSELNPNIRFIPCSWHIDRLWKARMKNLPSMLQAVRDLRQQTDIPEFWAKYETMGAMYRASPKKSEREAWKYFEENYGRYGTESNPEEWARSFNYGAIPHNLFIERMHGDFKFHYKSNLRIDQMMHAIREYSNRKSWDLAVLAQRVNIGVRCSQAQNHFNKDHDTAENYQIEHSLSFQAPDCPYTVTSPEGQTYTLIQNDLKQCNEGLCEVICKHCPSQSFCGHHLKCSCDAYKFANRCKHQHMVNLFRKLRQQQFRNETPMVPSGPKKVTKKTQQEQEQRIPVTHTKRKHSPQLQRIPVASRKRPREKEVVSNEDSDEYKLYKTLTTLSINDEQWGKTVCRSKEKFTEAIQIMPEKKQKLLISLYDAAKGHWECVKCEQHTIEKFLTKYVDCASCGNKYHLGCVSINRHGLSIDFSSVRQDDDLNCEECFSASPSDMHLIQLMRLDESK